MPVSAEPDEKGNITIPDELMPLFNYVGNQFSFVKYSNKNEILAVAHIINKAQKFFKENPELLNV